MTPTDLITINHAWLADSTDCSKLELVDQQSWSKMVAKHLILFLLAASVATVASIQVMFEQFKQCTSNGVLDCNLRVRKVNRTLATLYGNATLNVDLGDDFVVSINKNPSAFCVLTE